MPSMSLAKSIVFLALAVCGRIAPVAAALSTQQEVLVSTSPKLTVYSCFPNNNDVEIENDNDSADATEMANRQVCCESIKTAWKTIEEWRSDAVGGIFSFPMDQCLLELADIPRLVNDESDNKMANFAWMLPVIPNSESADPPHKQFLFNHQLSMEPIQTSSPFRKSTNEQQPMISIPITSNLDPNGGMHRLLHHSTTLLNPEETNRYLLYVVVPSGMFVDLDDALEVVDTANSQLLSVTPAEPLPEARRAFSFWQDDEAVATIHMHAAKTCDIEQPAFVSGQHLLIWEIHVQESNNAPMPLQFATKLHLRYPQPSSSMEQRIDLPKPMLYGYLKQNMNEEDLHKLKKSNDLPNQWQLEVLDPVWVAAGNKDDHDWVMGITMASCLIGVAWMLRDISRVATWDDI